MADQITTVHFDELPGEGFSFRKKLSRDEAIRQFREIKLRDLERTKRALELIDTKACRVTQHTGTFIWRNERELIREAQG